ncbi:MULTISPECIES: succinate dehydrogenase/fumarate reductase iron-sulfur subunit [Methanobacterium]|jgi:succinate dehydrogenase / fumarate reductase iron-sulfur subunit|uniref:succinate dehydrogenase n=1 Tax=Methanobacterium veterum TaxID=408577 RepID=A0A9E5DLA6_9EURY|nr:MULTISPECIES: succinate dehydrogenase/fumarate reductase iron-sulfur subunit [Methanobacterium]MCZ3365410.1 succinate dehydrogenase/fumarate reductase iron-sulfur subunit [Methanobacterium veterum]MCZ3373161.1 succinate dehydrogenase/fumarate reductase iron-sulfur subunit [Methanobacterium veterum]
MKLKVYRYNKKLDSPHYATFEFMPKSGMTILEALFQIQKQFDDSLAFHYSCRGAVCGTCAMLINKVPRLACRTQLTPLLKGELKINLISYHAIEETNVPWDPEEEILIEPLPHLPVIKDLIVDMSTFFKYYKFIEPVFKPANPAPEKERLMEPNALTELELYTNCILCAACFGACPVDGKNPEYLGPAALAKLYRFHIDPRESNGIERLGLANIPNGWWACEFYGNCTRVCPKGVPPTIGIAKARKELEDKGKFQEG